MKQELTAGVLTTDPKAHKRLERMLFNQAKQDRTRIFEEILFSKLRTIQKQTLSFLSPVGFLRKEEAFNLLSVFESNFLVYVHFGSVQLIGTCESHDLYTSCLITLLFSF